MDREILISTITQEVLRQMQAMQGSQSVASSQPTAVSMDGILLSDMRPGVKLTEIQQLLAKAKANNCGLCVPQWFIWNVKENLEGSKIKIATIVGLPEGTNSPLAKYAEIKQAVGFGVNMVLVPVNMDMCRAGDIKGVQKDLAESITASRGKAEAAAIIEVKDLNTRTLTDAALGCVAVGADGVMLSAITGGSVNPAAVRDLKAKGIKVGVIGGATGREAEYKQAGADWVVVRG